MVIDLSGILFNGWALCFSLSLPALPRSRPNSVLDESASSDGSADYRFMFCWFYYASTSSRALIPMTSHESSDIFFTNNDFVPSRVLLDIVSISRKLILDSNNMVDMFIGVSPIAIS